MVDQMQAAEKDLRTSVKCMKKRLCKFFPPKKGPLCYEDLVQMVTMVDAFRNDLHELSGSLNSALLLTPKSENGVPQVTRSSLSISDSGNESSASEKLFTSSPSPSTLNETSSSEKSLSSSPPPSTIDENFIAQLNAGRVSRRMKGEELRQSLKDSDDITEGIKKRFAEAKARRASLGQ